MSKIPTGVVPRATHIANGRAKMLIPVFVYVQHSEFSYLATITTLEHPTLLTLHNVLLTTQWLSQEDGSVPLDVYYRRSGWRSVSLPWNSVISVIELSEVPEVLMNEIAKNQL